MRIVDLVGANRFMKIIRDSIQLRGWFGGGKTLLAVTHQESPTQAEGGDQLSATRQSDPVQKMYFKAN